MKNAFLLVALVALVAGLSYAGDDEATTLSSTNPTVACAAVDAKRWYAVQCDGTARVKASTSTSDLPSNSSVQIPAGQLYDIATTYDRKYICVLAATGTVNCNIFHNRGPRE